MASTNSTIDGMGFEEMNQLGIQEANIMIAGSVVAGELGSFAGDLYGDNIYGTDGALKSALLGSATTNVWGGFIQAGSFETTTGSKGFIAFGTPYSSATSYYVNATATGSATGFEESYISGTRNISGVNFVGAAELRYDWIAVGN
jgi:hypothetical protein